MSNVEDVEITTVYLTAYILLDICIKMVYLYSVGISFNYLVLKVKRIYGDASKQEKVQNPDSVA